MSLLPHLLEVEAAVRVLSHDGLLAFPIDVLLKYPIAVSPTVAPYVGVGPSLILLQVEHVAVDDHHSSKELETKFGLAAAAGTYVWLSSSVGLVAELGYSLIFGSHGNAHELGASIGFIYGF